MFPRCSTYGICTYIIHHYPTFGCFFGKDYPNTLRKFNKSIEHDHRSSELSHQTWWVSILNTSVSLPEGKSHQKSHQKSLFSHNFPMVFHRNPPFWGLKHLKFPWTHRGASWFDVVAFPWKNCGTTTTRNWWTVKAEPGPRRLKFRRGKIQGIASEQWSHRIYMYSIYIYTYFICIL